MPEGDTLYRAAMRARAHLLGQPIVDCQTSLTHIDVERLVGAIMRSCRSLGKHLLMDFGDNLWLHTHLGMNGRWRFSRGRSRVSSAGGPNRIVLFTEKSTAWCFGAPRLELLSDFQVDRHPQLSSLGPDILDMTHDISALCLAFRSVPGDPDIASALLDQRRCAGIGNVYKSEGLFMVGVHPQTRLSALCDATLEQLLRVTRKWMFRNVGPGRRGTRWPGHGQHWVYERGGQRCIRCDQRVDRFSMGTPPRLTYVCARCQPLES